MAFTNATTAELRDLYNQCMKLTVMLRQYDDGSATQTQSGRFKESDITTQIAAVKTACTATES